MPTDTPSGTRVLAWFSCGAASAVAAKLAVEKYGDAAKVVYCDTLAEEHPDNRRFLSDVERWIGVPVEIIRSKRYATISDVFEQTGYMAGIHGARCTVEMKKVPRFEYQEVGDTHIFGLTADEGKRIAFFERNNPELRMDWVLMTHGVTKEECYQRLRAAGIALPAMYALGFKNNNCIGCVKATSSKYWMNVKKNFPEVFERRAKQSRALGVRLARLHGQRVFLDQLEAVDFEPEQDIECGPVCITEDV